MNSGAFARIQENPYQSIVTRNPFGLQPLPALKQPEFEPVPPAPLPEIKLTGITTLLGPPKALLQYEDKQTHKIEFPYPLSEGESYKTLMVIAIDVERARVHIRNGHMQSVLDFVNNGVAPAPRASPPKTIPPPALPNPIPNNLSPPNTGSRVVIGNPPPVASPALTNVEQIQRTALPPAMSREEAEALIEIARQKYAGQPNSQILPPTRLGNALSQPLAPASR